MHRAKGRSRHFNLPAVADIHIIVSVGHGINNQIVELISVNEKELNQ